MIFCLFEKLFRRKFSVVLFYFNEKVDYITANISTHVFIRKVLIQNWLIAWCSRILCGLKVLKVSKLNFGRFSHSPRDETFSRFIVENHNRFSGRYLQKTQVESSSRNLWHLILRPLLNIFIEMWCNNETLLSPRLSIVKDMLFRGPRTIDFKKTCIFYLIFVEL